MTQSLGAALITGTSSGIGHAAALAMHDAGFEVYATARDTAAITDLHERGLHTMALDVTDDDSMARGIATVEEAHGSVSVLVNNAGYTLYAPVETADPDAIRQQFETNVFGLVRLTQLALPAMRAKRRGRIINIGSMGGQVTFPAGGFYHATKHAVEAISDALRLEVAPFGIQVVLIQPGPIRTEFLNNAAVVEPSAEADSDPYAEFMVAADQANRNAYRGGVYARLALPAQAVAATIVKAASATHPRPRYAVGLLARSLMTTRRVLPDQAWDAFIKRQYPTPTPNPPRVGS